MFAILKKELNKQFPPEFLNRIDDIVYFNELNYTMQLYISKTDANLKQFKRCCHKIVRVLKIVLILNCVFYILGQQIH